jgi:hypothetical protein
MKSIKFIIMFLNIVVHKYAWSLRHCGLLSRPGSFITQTVLNISLSQQRDQVQEAARPPEGKLTDSKGFLRKLATLMLKVQSCTF